MPATTTTQLTTNPPRAASPAHHPTGILLALPDPGLRQAVRRLLAREGFLIVGEVAAGAAAVSAVAAGRGGRRPDLVVVSERLHGRLSGHDVARLVDAVAEDVAVVVMVDGEGGGERPEPEGITVVVGSEDLSVLVRVVWGLHRLRSTVRDGEERGSRERYRLVAGSGSARGAAAGG